MVTNRSFIANDPMLVGTAKKAEPEDSVTAAHRTVKTIQPVSAGMQPVTPLDNPSNPESASVLKPLEIPDPKPSEAAAAAEDSEPVSSGASEPSPAAETPASAAETPTLAAPSEPDKPSPAPEKPKPAEAEPKPEAAPEPEIPEAPLSESEEAAKKADADSEAQAAEDAKNQKLEELIASGTYAVPINAVQRKRSRMFVAAMCILALLLLVVLLDALLDVGIIKLPSVIPHTHFFSKI